MIFAAAPLFGAAAPLFSAAAQAATVTGVVRQRGTNDPIPGAEVFVAGQHIYCDARGNFVVEIEDGAHRLVVSAPAHQPAEVPIIVPLRAPVKVWLEPGEMELEIVIEADRSSPHAVRQILDRERVEKTPGTFDDPIRLLQSLPGVVATREYSPTVGEIAIRGSAPSESRIYLDGIEIPYLYHFQQYASVIHTRLLDEVAVYPSAFGSAYGDATGGVVSVSTRQAETDRVHGSINANLIMAGGYVTVPVGDSGAVSASARRSYADLIEGSNDQYTLWPTFFDYLSRYDRSIGTEHQLSVTALGAGDGYGRYAGDAAVLDPLEQEGNPAFLYARQFHGAVLRLVSRFERGGASTAVALMDDQWTGTLPTASQERAERYGWLRSEGTVVWSDRVQLTGGVESRLSSLELTAQTDQAWLELGDEAPLLARGVPVEEQLTRLKGGAWLEPHIQLSSWTVQPGARAQWDTATSSLTVDPRLTAQGKLAEKWGLRAGLGRYSQPPSHEELSPTIGDPSLPVSRAEHVALGVDTAIASRWEVALDGWGKRIHDAVVTLPGQAPTTADGVAYGVELTSRYRIRERFFSWTSLTLGRALRDGAVFSYDQPYAVSVVFSWNVTTRWELGARYRYAAGLPYTPIIGSLYSADTDTYLPLPGDTDSARMPDYQKVDLHLGYTMSLRRWSLMMYLEAWYVPPGANVLYPVYNFDYSEQAQVIGPSLVPLIGGRAEF